VLKGPRKAEVRKLHITRILIDAPAVLVARGHSGVIVASNPGDSAFLEEGYGFIGPGCVANQVTEVIGAEYPFSVGHVFYDGLQRREVCVDVGKDR
jgi:hypothetical protein